MNRSKVTQILETLNIRPDEIADERLSGAFRILPDDAEFKGYENVVVQEIIIKTDNVEYKKEIYYSPSQHKTYMGELPPEIEGEFGSGVKSLVCTLKHVANVSDFKLSEKLIAQLREWVSGEILDETQMHELLGQIFPDQSKGKIRRTRIMEAAAIAAYHQQTDFPVVEVLLSDDAPRGATA